MAEHTPSTQPVPEPLLTTEQVAKWLNMPENRLRWQARNGHIPATKIGAEFRFDRSDVEAFLKANRNEFGVTT